MVGRRNNRRFYVITETETYRAVMDDFGNLVRVDA